MVQERLTSSLAKGAAFQNSKKEKERMAASIAPPSSMSKTAGGKHGTWGPVYKNKQNFIDMHYS